MWKNDIALVKLEEDVPASDEVLPKIRSIQLISADNVTFPPDGHQCVMKGWGCTANGWYCYVKKTDLAWYVMHTNRSNPRVM